MIFFLCFFLSGFCGLVYQVVWLRMAMADFGVTTPLVSIVLSVFMAGLALGSWGGGRLIRRFKHRPAGFFVGLYGASELAIGVSGLVVAPLLRLGRSLLSIQSAHATWGSAGYYFASGGWVALIMLPFCACMGATFPLAMAGIKKSFSFLYLANVLGAMVGALGSAFVFIELMGFSKTLLLAAGVNTVVALLAFTVAGTLTTARESVPTVRAEASGGGFILPLLFFSGLSSLGMEVVWTRQFVPLVGPVVYCFATILAVYLLATAVGSQVYRTRLRFEGVGILAILAGCFALLPLLVADPRIPVRHQLLSPAVRISYGIGAFCMVLGFLTPMLVDRWSRGDAGRAGRAYAVNALGCILGPLLTGFIWLPAMGERWTLVVLALPFFVFGLWQCEWNWKTRALAMGAAVAAVLLVVRTRDFETLYPGARVRRDHTATVIAAGQGMDKKLLVNGVGITNLTPITKMMVHLPLAFLESPPQRVLVLCFGMGTSFRSALSWGVPVTVAELVPSIPSLFSYFHADGDALLRSPRATVVIDDARRYLERTEDSFDAIIIDPPPPVEAAGSSLLYSQEFYEIARRRLRPAGILQQWLPGGEPMVVSAFAQAIGRSFAEVRVFRSVEGWGYHFLASSESLSMVTAGALAAKMPSAAVRDLLEWGPFQTAEAQFQPVLGKEVSLQRLIDGDPGAPALTDDRPVNEYYFLRRY
jgi:spermidine synthase